MKINGKINVVSIRPPRKNFFFILFFLPIYFALRAMIDVEKGNDLFLNEQQACEMHLALALPARKKRKIL